MRLNSEASKHAGSASRNLVALSVFVVSASVFFRVPLLPAIGEDVGMSAVQLAGITTAFAVGRLGMDLPAGLLADRDHPYRLMKIASVLAAGGTLAVALAQVSVAVYLGALLLGLASAISNSTGLHFFSTAAPSARRGTSVSLFSSTLLVGQAVGPPIAAFLASFGSWRTAHLVAGGALVALLATVMASGRQLYPRADRESSEGTPRSTASPSAQAGPLGMAILLAVPFLMLGTFGATMHTLVPIIGDRLGVSIGSIGVALGIGGGARVASIAIGGQIADRFSRKGAIVPGVVISSLGISLLALATNYSVWLISIIAISAGTTAISVSATMIADQSKPGRTGRSLGAWRFVGDLGLITVPLLVGWIFQEHGEVWSLMPLSGALALAGVGVALVTPETRNQ